MAIWKNDVDLATLQAQSEGTLVSHLGVEFIEIGDDFLRGRMPVDARTIQPAGILHGGASVALAETLGSVAANLCVDRSRKACVGLEINANHVRSVRPGDGYVIGTARPLHIGGSTQIWEIRIENEAGKLVCMSRLTMAVLNR